jgi:hypothetical protein
MRDRSFLPTDSASTSASLPDVVVGGGATTATVVECVVAIVLSDLAFTAIFFALGLT